MPPWNWTWEDSSPGESSPVVLEAHDSSTVTPRPQPAKRPGSERGATSAPPRPPARSVPPGNGAGGHGRPNYHRRRIGAAVGLGALLILVIALAASGGGASTRAHKRSAQLPAGHPAHKPVPAPSSEPTQQQEEQAINHVLSYTPAVVEGGRKGNEVALTFDDGPGPYTPHLVRTLNSLHVHATFFAIGEMERYFSEGTRLELRSGDVVGDHTETHPMLATMTAQQQREEMLNQMVRIELLGGARPRLFRPPYGSFNTTTFRELGKLHLLTILWSTDTADFRCPACRRS